MDPGDPIIDGDNEWYENREWYALSPLSLSLSLLAV
jgi:hypothetical protein